MELQIPSNLPDDLQIKKSDFKQSFTIKVYPYIKNLLNKLQRHLSKILSEKFDFNTQMTCLLAEHRERFGGFNRSFAIEFAIYFFNKFYKSDLRDEIIIPELKQFLIKKNNVKIIDDLVNESKIK